MESFVFLLITAGMVSVGGVPGADDLTAIVDDSSIDCEVKVDGQCYWTYIQKRRDVNFARAEHICAEHNSTPAVIPNHDAYRDILSSVRAKIPSARTWTSVWTGMRFNPRTREETPHQAYWRWFFIPVKDSKNRIPWVQNYYTRKFTHVYLEVKRFARSRFQGMINREPSAKKKGVICQKIGSTIMH